MAGKRCPGCGFPKVDGKTYRGIYTPGKPCMHCKQTFDAQDAFPTESRTAVMEIARRLRGLEGCLNNTLRMNITEEERTNLTARRGIYSGIADDIDRDYKIDSRSPHLSAQDVGCSGSKPVDSIRCYDEHSAVRMLSYAPRMQCRLCFKPTEIFVVIPNEYGFNVFPGYCKEHGAAMLRPYENSTVMGAPTSTLAPGSTVRVRNGWHAGHLGKVRIGPTSDGYVRVVLDDGKDVLFGIGDVEDLGLSRARASTPNTSDPRSEHSAPLSTESGWASVDAAEWVQKPMLEKLTFLDKGACPRCEKETIECSATGGIPSYKCKAEGCGFSFSCRIEGVGGGGGGAGGAVPRYYESIGPNKDSEESKRLEGVVNNIIHEVLEESKHSPTCASFDFDPEKQLGPDKPCDCGKDKPKP